MEISSDATTDRQRRQQICECRAGPGVELIEDRISPVCAWTHSSSRRTID